MFLRSRYAWAPRRLFLWPPVGREIQQNLIKIFQNNYFIENVRLLKIDDWIYED